MKAPEPAVFQRFQADAFCALLSKAVRVLEPGQEQSQPKSQKDKISWNQEGTFSKDLTNSYLSIYL